MKFICLIVFGVLISSRLNAADIQTSGDTGVSYTIKCKNEVAMNLNYEGTTPNLHIISSNHPPIECTVQKDKSPKKLIVTFNLQPANSNGSSTSIAPTSASSYTLTLTEPNQSQTVQFTGAASPSPHATAPRSQLRRRGLNVSGPIGN